MRRALRLPRPSLLVVASLLLSGGLALLAGAAGIPEATPAEAALFEGQGDVRMVGLLDNLRAFPDGWQAQLHRDGTAILVRGEGAPVAPEGTWSEAQGRIGRSGGRLVLLADAVRPLQSEDATATPTWAALAQDVAAWDHRPILLRGWVEKGELRDHDGHGVRLATGAWPAGPGAVR
ncbi:MAG TPA: hypothetical protein VM286_10570 [Candidatus Thermoplasmatota archaeon]|nr:hypothetical protein [Candidatus Thermoplasmatota archaeon]